jgi:ABC-2 type transport system ATP-binding protein
MGYAVEINNLRKKYKDAWSPALDGLSLNIEEGKVVGLLGPNGAGKTTCIHILCGLVKADEGKAVVFGKDCYRESKYINKMTGVVPQKIALFGELTAKENLEYIGKMYGLGGAQVERIAKDMLERLGLAKHADKAIKKYSGGMRRRANIIASLLHQPKLLILDEPTAGVDVQSRALIIDFLKEYNKAGNTILYTSHLMEEAEQLCDEVVIIDEGKKIIEGAPKTLIKETEGCRRLEDVFLHHTGHALRDEAE